MSAERHPVAFEPLPLKHREILAVEAGQYRVRSLSGETREIKADTAYEAFRNSGLKDIIKIERLSRITEGLLQKDKFRDTSDQGQDEVDPHDAIRRRRNPIISADELDSLIRASLHAEPMSSSETVEIAAPQLPPGSAPAPLVVEQPPLPEPDLTVPVGVQSPTGLDVHGDGFDEIIPSQPPVAAKSAAAKASPPAEMPTASPAPEKELSPEEVANLLSGKPE